MLGSLLAALVLGTGADTTIATVSVTASQAEGPQVEWVMLDSSGIAIEVGTTPTTMEVDVTARVLTICANALKDDIRVLLTVEGRGQRLEGTSHCFRIGIEKGRLILHAAFDPRTKP